MRGKGARAFVIRRLLGAARLTTMRMQQPIPSASKPAPVLLLIRSNVKEEKTQHDDKERNQGVGEEIRCGNEG